MLGINLPEVTNRDKYISEILTVESEQVSEASLVFVRSPVDVAGCKGLVNQTGEIRCHPAVFQLSTRDQTEQLLQHPQALR